jgi:hypothetical protein
MPGRHTGTQAQEKHSRAYGHGHATCEHRWLGLVALLVSKLPFALAALMGNLCMGDRVCKAASVDRAEKKVSESNVRKGMVAYRLSKEGSTLEVLGWGPVI